MATTWASLAELLRDTDDHEPVPREGLEALLDLIAGHRPAWHARAACAGADLQVFFPERGESTEPARSLCSTCPVAGPCLEEALRHTTAACPGIWGGTSARERRQLRREAA